MTASVATTWMTAAEASTYLGLPTRAALYKRVERGQVPAHRWGRQLRFRRSELDALMGPVCTGGGTSTKQEARQATGRRGAATTLLPPLGRPGGRRAP